MSTTAADLELAFYERFFWAHGREPYPVQERAIGTIFSGASTMVAVPTGTGKTVIAKAALFAALARGQRAVYTTPLRALTEEKYRELCDDFGVGNVGFATGDYKVNRDAPLQVEVAEILWNRVYTQRGRRAPPPPDVVVMDEGHYFNDPERGYVWEQAIIGLDPRAQLVILSATVGHADRFCHWVELTRRQPMQLVESRERKVPLAHEYREELLIDTVKELAARGEVPAIVFCFGRELCWDVARLIKSCRRFTTDLERARIELECDHVLLPGGVAKELRPLLAHGIGVHHAGLLPAYKHLVERLALERLVRFVVSTETISAGINLPARTVVFPALRKWIKKEPRLVTPAEFHQMAGRAGRPQFDDRGLAVAMAPEEVVVELKKELKDAAKRPAYDQEKVRKSVYNRARSEAQRKGEVTWSPEVHQALVDGEPAELRSRTKITAEQVLAIGLPDLATTVLPGDAGAAASAAAEAALPPALRLDIVTVIDHLLLDDRERRAQHKTLAQLVANLRAIDVLDEHGQQIGGWMIRRLQGLDGPLVYYALSRHPLDYEELRGFVEYLVDHDVVQRVLDRKGDDARREWCRAKLRELREANGLATWEDAEAAYAEAHPRPLTRAEVIHQEFAALVPHPELHGGKRVKDVWARMEDGGLAFLDFVEREHLQHEEGSLFTYLARVQATARTLFEACELPALRDLADRVRAVLARVDARA